MKLNVMKIIEVDLIVVLIFYSFNNVLSVLEFIKYLCEWIGLLSNYHNRFKFFWWIVRKLVKCKNLTLSLCPDQVFCPLDEFTIGVFILNSIIFIVVWQTVCYLILHTIYMDGIVIEAGKIFLPPCLPQRQVWLGLEVFKTFVVSDHHKLSTQKFILPFHERFQDDKCLVFMCMVVMLCACEFLQ